MTDIATKEAPTHVGGIEMKYFVLKPRGSDSYAAASRAALLAYASGIEGENPELAADLRDWAARERDETWAVDTSPENM